LAAPRGSNWLYQRAISARQAAHGEAWTLCSSE
jgi:hypothetical protein